MKNKIIFVLVLIFLVGTFFLVLPKNSTIDLSNKEEIEFQYLSAAKVYKLANNLYEIDIDSSHYIVGELGNIKQSDYPDYTLIDTGSSEIYVAASQVMDLINQLSCIDRVSFTSTDSSSWGDQTIRNLISNKDILYIGKYDSPDFEALLQKGCDFCIENTMIYHSPKIKEELESLGIPVFVDFSSKETTALGRLEWIKIYGILLGEYDKSFELFDSWCKEFDSIDCSDTGKTVVYFSLSNGVVTVRESNNYIADLINSAGGNYIPENIDSTHMSLETFYRVAIDADVIIYNGTIDKTIQSENDLLKEFEQIKDFKAYKNHNIWISTNDTFQSISSTVQILKDLNNIFKETNFDEITFFKRL